MILHIPITSIQDGQVRVASHVETASPVPNLPKDLWYQFPDRYESNLSVRADGFAATALLTAMYLGNKPEAGIQREYLLFVSRCIKGNCQTRQAASTWILNDILVLPLWRSAK